MNNFFIFYGKQKIKSKVKTIHPPPPKNPLTKFLIVSNVFLTLAMLIGILTFSGGWHIPEEILSGTFKAAYNFSQNVTFQNNLNYDLEKFKPFTSCKDILEKSFEFSKFKLNSGIYKINPDGTNEFEVYCDMITDGGGWTLVWSNLRGGSNKPTTSLNWNNAINTIPIYQNDKQLNTNLEEVVVYTGLKYWKLIGENEIRYDWANDYNSNIDQSFIADYSLDENDFYRINMTNYNQRVGETEAGFYLTHNGMKFTTHDSDNDIHLGNGNCGTFYSLTPFWYNSCWSGSINGGGENEGSGKFNGAYWYKANLKWGTDDGEGAGNGWIFIR